MGEFLSFSSFWLLHIVSTFLTHFPFSPTHSWPFQYLFIRRSLQLPRLIRLSVYLTIYAVIHPPTDLHTLFILSPYRRGYIDNNNDDWAKASVKGGKKRKTWQKFPVNKHRTTVSWAIAIEERKQGKFKNIEKARSQSTKKQDKVTMSEPIRPRNYRSW